MGFEILTAWLLGIIGLLLIVTIWQGWIKVGTKAMTPLYIVGIVMILINVGTSGILTKLVVEEPTYYTPPALTITTPATPAAGISAIEDITVTFNSHDQFKKGSESTGVYNHRVFLKQNDGTWSDLGEFAEGATTTVSTFDTLRVIARFNESSTDGSGNVTYPHMIEEQMPGTKGTKVFDVPVVNVDNAPTVTVWLKDKSVMASGNAQAMDASSQYKNAIQIEASNDDCFGNYFHQGSGNAVCFQYNQTVIQKMALNDAMTAPVPTDLAASAGLKANCYYFPVLCDNAVFDGYVITDTASTAPSDASGNNAIIYLYDTSMDIDSDYLFSYPVIYGFEDEDNYDLGATSSEASVGKVFYVS